MKRSAACLPLFGALALGLGPRAVAQTDGTEEVLESTRESVRSTAEWLARGVDSWFGDKPFERGGKVSDGRLLLGVLKRQQESTDYKLRFNARFRLPNLEERAYVFIGRDNPREVLADTPQALTRQQQLQSEARDDNRFFAGVGFALLDRVDFRLGMRSGLKPYVQGRYNQSWTVSERERIDFRETLFFSVSDRLGSSTALSYEYALTPALAVRWLNNATITQKTREFEWSTNLGLYRLYGRQRLLSLEALMSGMTGQGVAVGDYGLQAKWEQPLHKDWLLGEVMVGRFWPRPDRFEERRSIWAVGGTLKLLF